MSRHVTPVHRLRRRTAGAVLALAALGAGCGSGGLPPASSTPHPSSTPVATLAATAGIASPTPDVPSPTPASASPLALAEPPAAALSGVTPGDATAGELGSFTWDGSGTDAPWIVPRAASKVSPGARLDVAFEPSVGAESWTARWARVADGTAGDVASGVDGSGPVSITVPGDAGTWSLQLEASFGRGRGATWYWRLEVAP